MNKKIALYLNTLLLGCTTIKLQPLPPPTQQEQEIIALNPIEQYFSTTCEKYIITKKEIHCSLPKEPYYFHYRWDEIKQTSCHRNKLVLETILDTKTIYTPNVENCVDISMKLNTYLRITKKR